MNTWDSESRNNLAVAKRLSGQPNSYINTHVRDFSLNATFAVNDALFVFEMVGLECSFEGID